LQAKVYHRLRSAESRSLHRDPAARIALRAARDFLTGGTDLELVRWVLFNDAAFDAFLAAAKEVLES